MPDCLKPPNGELNPVPAVVGDADRVLSVVTADQDDDRTEELLLRKGHVVADMGQTRRLDVPPLRQVCRHLAARGHGGAFLDALAYERQHAIAAGLRDQRSDYRVLLAWIADLEGGESLGEPSGKPAAVTCSAIAKMASRSRLGTFTTTMRPATSAGAASCATQGSTKLIPQVTATTPTGSFTTRLFVAYQTIVPPAPGASGVMSDHGISAKRVLRPAVAE